MISDISQKESRQTK